MIKWPDLVFPPINLYSFPSREVTPCIKKCKLEDGICTGCKRTPEEIQDWSLLTYGQKIILMRELKQR
jgi:predicted Fe-S protein YdhL (DUF1289 family)